MKKIFNIISLCILLCSGVYASENPPPKLFGITLFENMDKNTILSGGDQAVFYDYDLLKILIPITIVLLIIIFLFFKKRTNLKDKNTYPDYLFVRSNRQNIRISLDEIWAVEALKDYIKIVCGDKNHIVHSNLSSFERKLPTDRFIRIHRSFIVNINKITSLDGDIIYLDKKYYKIGGKYIEDLKIHLNINKI